MKKLIIVLFSLLALALTPSLATAACNGYMPKHNDNLWDITGAKTGHPEDWQRIWDLNPKIQTRVISYHAGKIIVPIYTTDCILGLSKSGWVLPVDVSGSVTTNIGTSGSSPAAADSGLPWWLSWLIAGFLLVMLVLTFGQRDRAEEALAESESLNLDPVTSGPAIVPGGVNDVGTANARFAESAGNASRVSSVLLQVTDTVAGRIYGTLDVSYRDGTTTARRHHGERAWQANVHFPDGHTEVMYMLQACGNDLRFGSMTEHQPGADFRFEPDAPAQAPAPAAAPAAQAPVADEVGAEPNLEGVDIFIQLQEPTGNKPARLMHKGVKNVVLEGRANGITVIRFEAQ